MAQQCSHCGKDHYPAYTCNYCDFVYCSDHRLPENHNCPGLSTQNSASPHLESDAPSTLGQTSDLTERKGDSVEKPDPVDKRINAPSAAKEPPTSSSPAVKTKNSNSDGDNAGSISNVSDTSSSKEIINRIFGIMRFVLFLPVILITKLTNLCRAVLGVLYSPKVVLAGIIAVIFISATIGTGIPAIDNTINDSIDASSVVLANATDEQSGRDTQATSETSNTPTRNDHGVDTRKIEEEVHRLINDRRAEYNLAKLNQDSELRNIARSHSVDMANQDYFAHESPDGEDFADRYEQAGYNCEVQMSENRYATGGENIAYTYADTNVRKDDGAIVNHRGNETEIAKGLVSGWMNSPGHRENILEPHWENEGIGVALTREEGNIKVLATQNFC